MTSHRVDAQATLQFKVILDPETFHADNFVQFQTLADQVASEVDHMIPGLPKDIPVEGIICFESPETWNDTGRSRSPITLKGPKQEGEPNSTKADVIRIAVFGVQPLYMRRFVMQLAHELAHVKMGSSVDNALIETFAMSVSYEVLRRFGMFDYLYPMLTDYFHKLPQSIQLDFTNQNIKSLKQYWITQFNAGWERMDDRTLQNLGFLLLQRDSQPDWVLLFGVAEKSTCGGSRSSAPLSLCQPDIKGMIASGLKLDALGFQ